MRSSCACWLSSEEYAACCSSRWPTACTGSPAPRARCRRSSRPTCPCSSRWPTGWAWTWRPAAPVKLIREAFGVSSHTLFLLTLGVAAYGALELLEAVGLWLLRRWGEYVAVVGTSIFLPLEIRELIDRVTVLRLLTFAINIAAVAYLLYTKRLFGLRGGRAAFEAERHADSLLEVEAAALS